MTDLLDVNVLIALIDRSHVHHAASVEWFESVGNVSWATCPITENGLLRILSNVRYRNGLDGEPSIFDALREFTVLPGHLFWPDAVSLLDIVNRRADVFLTANQITDIYLLGLARTNGGQLATFDRRIPVQALEDGARSLCLLG